MLDEHIDLVACDVNGTAWRRQTNGGNLSIMEDGSADSDLPMPPGPTPLFVPGAVPGTWSNVCRFLKPLDSYERWKVRQHGAFSTYHEALGLRLKDQSCHHQVWLHMVFVDHHSSYETLEKHEQRLLLKRRSALYQHNKERCKADEDESDRSLSSKAQATIRFRHNCHTGNAAPMSTVEGTHDAVHHALRSVTG